MQTACEAEPPSAGYALLCLQTFSEGKKDSSWAVEVPNGDISAFNSVLKGAVDLSIRS